MRKVAWAAFAILAGCSPSPSSQPQGYVHLEESGHHLWPNPQHIPVCYVSKAVDSGHLDFRRSVEEHVTQQFKKAGLHLVGFKTCKGDKPAIRVLEKGDVNKTKGFGIHVADATPGLYLSFKPTVLKRLGCLEHRFETCARSIALHEFGHALGLHHEMNRRDDPLQCRHDQKDDMGEDEAMAIGDYDSDSIMNYCKVFQDAKRGRKSSLSQGDIATLRELYFGVIAGILQKPAAFVKEGALSFAITGPIDHYRYQWGLENLLDCKDPDRYLPLTPGENPITLDLGAKPREGRYRVCVLGQKAGRTQNPRTYSALSFTVDRTPPIFRFKNNLESPKPPEVLSLAVVPTVHEFRFKVGPYPQDCENPEGYGAFLPRRFRFILGVVETGLVLDLKDWAGKTLELCVVARDQAQNVQSFASASRFTFTVSPEHF